jgi:short-subunit dehydrogenase
MTRQRVLITGASSGLGAEMARIFAAKGRDLALCARRLDRLEALRAELLAAHPTITVAVRALDVNDHDAVFRVFDELRDDLGGLDRVIVNAGLGKGARIGTGRFHANRETAMTNFVGALAQCEAAMQHFRAVNAGHLVVVSSLTAIREMPGNLTTYAASKAAVARLANGLRAEMHGTPIRVTTLYPGYVATEMSGRKKRPLTVSAQKGAQAMVGAIEREVGNAVVPRWPWRPLSVLMRYAPARVLRRFTA